MAIIGLRFVVPLVNSLIEAQSNALIFGLFNKLQKESVGVGYEIHTNKQSWDNEDEEDSIVKT